MTKAKTLKNLYQASKKLVATLVSLAMVLLLVPGLQRQASAADTGDITVTIGTGTSAGYYVPYDPYYQYSTTETLYKASEINQIGTIKSIAYNVNAAKEFATSGVKIYFATTSQDTLTTAGLDGDAYTLVYSGTPTLGQTTGWETLQLDVPFFYDGEQNLVVAVCKSTASSTGTTNQLKYTYTSTDTADSVVIFQKDNNDSYGDVSTKPATGTAQRYKANVQFVMAPPVDPKPACSATSNAVQAGSVANLNVDASKNALGEDIDSTKVTITGYQWKYSLNGADAVNAGEKVSSSATSNSLDFTIPTSATLGDEYVFSCDVEYTLDGATKTATSDAQKVTVVTATEAATPAEVSVTPTATEVQQGADPVSATVTYSIADEGKGDITYQWYTCDQDGSNPVAIEGETSDTLEIQAADTLGKNYYCCKVINTFEKVKVKETTSTPIEIETKGLEISDAAGLKAFAEKVNSGTDFDGLSIILTKDIDMSSVIDFAPIGSYTSYNTYNAFKGNFDGQGHVIKNLTINSANTYTGLFGYVLEGASISNVKLTNVEIISTSTSSTAPATASLVGYLKSSTVLNSGAEGSITAACGYTGGLVGYAYGSTSAKTSIKTSYFDGSVAAGSGKKTTQVGGLVGYMQYTDVADSYSSGTSSNTYSYSSAYASGLIGSVGTTCSVKNCFTTATPTSVYTTSDNTAALAFISSSSYTSAFSTDAPCYYLEGIANTATGSKYSPTDGAVVSKTASELASNDFVTTLNAKAAEANTFVVGPDSHPVLRWNATDAPVVTLSPDSFDTTQVCNTQLTITADASKNAQGNTCSASINNYKWTYSIAGGEATEISSSSTATSATLTIPQDAVGKELKITCEVGYTLDGQAGTASSDVSMKVVSSVDAGTPTDVVVSPSAATVTQGGSATTLTCQYTEPATGWGTPSYQWYTCDADGNNAQKIENATSQTYDAQALTTLGDAYYKCSIINTFETYKVTEPVYSSVAKVTTQGLSISNANELNAFITAVNGGKSYDGLTVTLANDIDMDGANLSPIGLSNTAPFKGIFDGQGHTISNFEVNSDNQFVGFFGYIAGSAIAKTTIKNLNLEGNVSYVGEATSTITGGIVGQVMSSGLGVSLENLSFNGKIDKPNGGMAGGIVASFSGTTGLCNISYCYSKATITTSGEMLANVGGICGFGMNVTINDCGANLTASVQNTYTAMSSNVAGILAGSGFNGDKVSNCYATGTMTGSDTVKFYGIIASSSASYMDADKPSYYLASMATNIEENSVAIAKTEDELQDSELVAAMDANGANTAGNNHTWLQSSGGTYPLLWWQVDTSLPKAALIATYPTVDSTEVHPNETIQLSVDTSKTIAGDVSSANVTSYAWYKKDVTANSDPVKISGDSATNTYTFTSADTSGHTIKFYVEVTYSQGLGSDVVESNSVKALLISNTPAAVPTNLSVDGPTTVGQTQTVTLTPKYDIDETGKGEVSVQWFSCDNTSGDNPKQLSAETDNSLKVTGDALGTNYYYFEVTNVFEQTKVQVVESPVFAIETTNLNIKTASELLAFAQAVNGGKTFDDCTVELGADIDMENVAMVPIGISSTYKFMGTFNGNNHTISNLSIEDSKNAYVGLFGYIAGATIKDFVLKDASITSTSATNIGGVVAYSYPTSTSGPCIIQNIGFNGNVVSNIGNVGGFVGYAYGSTSATTQISSCYVHGKVSTPTGTYNYKNVYVGGFVGNMSAATISNSYTDADVDNEVTASSTSYKAYAGSFAGYIASASAEINNCYATGTVKAAGSGCTYGFGYAGTNYAASVFSATTPCYYLSTNGESTNGTSGTPATDALLAKDATYFASDDIVAALNTAAGSTAFKYGGACPALEWEEISTIADASTIEVASDLTYTGTEQTGVVAKGYGYTLSNVSATDVDTYTATATLKSGWTWSDNTTDAKTFSWSIAKAQLSAKYTGETIASNASPALTVEVSGFVNNETAATAKDYTAPTVTAPVSVEAGKTYSLTPSGGAAANYEFTYVAGDLVIDLSVEKTAAKAAIDTAVTSAKADVAALGELTTEQKTAYDTQIDDAAAAAKSKIDAAKTLDAIATEKTDGETQIGAVVSAAKDADAKILADAKTDAKAEIDAAVTDANKTIDALGGLTAEQKTEYKNSVSAKATEAKNAIDVATNSTDVASAKVNGLSAINEVLIVARAASAQALLEAQTAAKAAIDTAVTSAKADVAALGELTTEQKAAYDTQIDDAAAAAKSKIDAAKTLDAIATEKTDGETQIGAVVSAAKDADAKILADAKTDAKAEIDAQLKSEIENIKALDSLSEDEVNKFVGQLREAAAKANDAIDAVTSSTDVDAQKTEVSKSFEKIKSDAADANKAAFEKAQSQAEEDLKAAADQAKKDIEDMQYLSTDERSAFEAKIDEALTKALESVKATTNGTELKAAVQSATDSLTAVKTAAKKADDEAKAIKTARLAVGKTIKIGNYTYTVLKGQKTVSIKANKAKKIKKLSIASSVKDANGNVYIVTGIAAKGFKNCKKLTKVNGGKNIVEIGAKAFAGCKKLKSVTIKSKNLKKIGKKAFYKTIKLTKITIKKTTKLKTVKGAFKKAGKNSGKKLTLKVKSSKKKAYKKLILKKGGNKKLTVK